MMRHANEPPSRAHPYEVRGTRGSDTLTIGCDTREVAEDTARTFRREGYADVEIVETR
jgi:hypothetical protein